MKQVIIKFTNGGSIRIALTEAQYTHLVNGGGVETKMYGFIPDSMIDSYRVV